MPWPWIAAAAAIGFAPNAATLLVLRFLLGVAEAGLFPGVIFYLTRWFPQAYRARVVALFMVASALIVGTLALREQTLGDVPSYALEFLLAFMLACLVYYALQAFRRSVLESQAAQFADQDIETQLLNRRGFDNAARYLVPLHQRTQLPLVIVLASLDTRNAQPLEMKLLSKAVRQVGHVVRQRARRSDVVARLSEDEFVFMLFDTPMAGAESLARSLLDRFNAWSGQQGVDVRLTFGLVNTPEDTVAIDQLIARARSAVERAQKHPSSPAVVTAPSL